MITGIVFSILSIFTFAQGWEMWRDNLKRGSLIGIVEQNDQRVILSRRPKIKLSELDGKLVQESETRDDGRFLFSKIHPGQYLLEIEAPFLSCPTKTVNVFPSRDSDIGSVSCALKDNSYWQTILTHSQLTSALYANDGTIWATGFRTSKNHRNSYVLFQKEPESNKFTDVVIPEINDAERGSFLHQFSTGEIILGTSGKGAVISRDNGISWSRIGLDLEITSTGIAKELPDGTWILVGNRLNTRQGIYPENKPRNSIFSSNNRGKTWELSSDHMSSIISFLNHSSGRLIIGTQALDGSAGLSYSEDGGATWLPSTLGNIKNLRGIGTIIELSDGSLLAGTLDGKKWKSSNVNDGEFLKGGRILRSESAGKSWFLYAGNDAWGDVNAILQLSNNELMASEGSNLIWSNNYGENWFNFGKNFGTWLNCLADQEEKIVAVSNSGLSELPKNRIILNYIK
jgi:hypothetical protein